MAEPAPPVGDDPRDLHSLAVDVQTDLHKLATGLTAAGAAPQAVAELTKMADVMAGVVKVLGSGPSVDAGAPGAPGAAPGGPQGVEAGGPPQGPGGPPDAGPQAAPAQASPQSGGGIPAPKQPPEHAMHAAAHALHAAMQMSAKNRPA